ncbi:MAG: NAD(+)/NADH kinase [Chloroflexi bacterium]|nr:NAD(+)/NADH kinase [Chloroflexota bacterium]
MSTEQKPIHHVAIVVHPKMTGVTAEAEYICTYLNDHQISTFLAKTNQPELTQKLELGEFDLMIALGGDGTMLRAGHLTAPLGLPLLGINLGRFGFLMQLSRSEWREFFPRLLTGEYQVENRMMLQAEHWRKDVLLDTFQVINEVVVCRGQVVRPIRIRAEVDGYLLASYVADGLIAATPTGSTAYALAVGGPIMPPELHNILIVPVAPHLSMDRAVILPIGACVNIFAASDHQAVMSIDGHTPVMLKNEDRVLVAASKYHVRFVVFQDPGYFYRNLSNYLERNPSIGEMK